MGQFSAEKTLALPIEKKVILIDPGHGGVDGGASGNGVTEKYVTLEIAKYLQKYVETGGGVAYLTRTEDTNTADPNRGKGVSQKMSDLKERKKDIEDVDADIFVSIHLNNFSQSKYRGAQTFYDGKNDDSKALAEFIQQGIKDVVKDDNNRVPKDGGNSIFLLRDSKIPSSLVECGFLSNPEESKLLATSEYQRKIAWGIYVGILRFFSR